MYVFFRINILATVFDCLYPYVFFSQVVLALNCYDAKFTFFVEFVNSHRLMGI